MKDVKPKVLRLLENYEQLRDSDKLLWLAYLVNYASLRAVLGDESYEKLKEIVMRKSTPTMETITRCRRKIQEENPELGAKKKVEQARQEKEKVFRKWSKE